MFCRFTFPVCQIQITGQFHWSALCQLCVSMKLWCSLSLLSINENVVIRLAAEKRRQFVFVLAIKVFFIQKNKETRIQKNVARLCTIFTLFTCIHLIYND